ncbi:MAG: RNA polymerase sigma factor [Hyphomicrobiaceae bacterium]|nr:RNA polymerase sigma factor [Hyphomicrobiaceae bacterium]
MHGSISADRVQRLLDAYNENREGLRLFLTRRLRCPAIAEDLIQETWIRIVSRPSDDKALTNPKAYLFRIAFNLSIDHHRKESRRAEVMAELANTNTPTMHELTPERHHLAASELTCMKNAVACLPERCRQVFYLSRFENISRQEIARRLGISKTTVDKDLRHVLQQLVSARKKFRDAGL